MNKTPIEWVKNPDGTQGYTWNPITGCLNCTPEGLCRGGMFPCYAYKLANGRLKSTYLANSVLPTHDEPNHEAHHSDPFFPRFWEDRLEDIKRPPAPSAWANNASYTNPPLSMLRGDYNRHAKKKARGIFTCDMSDLFGIGIPEYWTKKVLGAIQINGIDRFYILTKQPQNLIKFSPFPDNCWVGVTATDHWSFLQAQWQLGEIEAKVNYISFEPLLAEIPLNNILGVDWVIIGSQTNPYKPPKIEGVKEIVGAANKAGIPVFLKDNLKPIMSFPESLWAWGKHENGIYTGLLRQEMPDIK